MTACDGMGCPGRGNALPFWVQWKWMVRPDALVQQVLQRRVHRVVGPRPGQHDRAVEVAQHLAVDGPCGRRALRQ